MLLHITVEALHVLRGIRVSPIGRVWNGVVIIRPAPVDGFAEGQRFRRLRETAQAVFLAITDNLFRIEAVAACMVVVIVGEEHVIHIRDGRIHARNIAGYPFLPSTSKTQNYFMPYLRRILTMGLRTDSAHR